MPKYVGASYGEQLDVEAVAERAVEDGELPEAVGLRGLDQLGKAVELAEAVLAHELDHSLVVRRSRRVVAVGAVGIVRVAVVGARDERDARVGRCVRDRTPERLVLGERPVARRTDDDDGQRRAGTRAGSASPSPSARSRPTRRCRRTRRTRSGRRAFATSAAARSRSTVRSSVRSGSPHVGERACDRGRVDDGEVAGDVDVVRRHDDDRLRGSGGEAASDLLERVARRAGSERRRPVRRDRRGDDHPRSRSVRAGARRTRPRRRRRRRRRSARDRCGASGRRPCGRA